MYAVIGASGYLGSYIIKNILMTTKENIIATTRNMRFGNKNDRVKWMECDVQDDCSVDSFIKKLVKADETIKLIYLAAFHHPDQVQYHPDLAWDINVTSLSKIINKFCKGGGKECINVFYASTDSVYGESLDGYHFKETDGLRPVNFYGHCKCAAEALILHRGYHVVRFPFLIAPSVIEKPHFYDQIVSCLKEGNEMKMYEDPFRSSLSFDNAAFLLIQLIETGNCPEIINICGDKDLSKYDVGRMIAEREHLDVSKIIPVKFENFQDGFKTRRARSTLMDNHVLKEFLKLKMIDIFEHPL